MYETDISIASKKIAELHYKLAEGICNMTVEEAGLILRRIRRLEELVTRYRSIQKKYEKTWGELCKN